MTLNGLPRRVRLNEWLYTSPDPVLGAEITSVSSYRSPKAVTSRNPSMVVVPSADTRSTGRYFQVMAQTAIDKIPPGPKLDALTAEKVFGWRKVHQHQGSIIGRKQDKAGHWRRAKVPNYSTNPLHSYSVENRMKQLERFDRYQNELFKITPAKS